MTMQRILFVFPLVLAFAGTGCGGKPDAGGELNTKSEYSVLQSFEFDYRQRTHALPYVIGKNALSSGYDVIGLPRTDGERGYVWLIANPSGAPAIKQMPSGVDFSISSDTLAVIEKSAQLDSEVRSYLAAHIHNQ